MIFENRTKWNTEDLASVFRAAHAYAKEVGAHTWVNDETVVCFLTYAAQKASKSFGVCRADSEANLIEVKLLRPGRMKGSVVDTLADVVREKRMPDSFFKNVSHMLDLAARGSGFYGHGNARTTFPEWVTEDMAIRTRDKSSKTAPVFYARMAKINQKRLDQEHKQWLSVRASRQKAIDALWDRAKAT